MLTECAMLCATGSDLPAAATRKFPPLRGCTALRVPDGADARLLLRGQLAVSVSRADDGAVIGATGTQEQARFAMGRGECLLTVVEVSDPQTPSIAVPPLHWPANQQNGRITAHSPQPVSGTVLLSFQTRHAVTGLQLPGVIDELFYYEGPLGARVGDAGTAIDVWAPTAQQVTGMPTCAELLGVICSRLGSLCSGRAVGAHSAARSQETYPCSNEHFMRPRRPVTSMESLTVVWRLYPR